MRLKVLITLTIAAVALSLNGICAFQRDVYVEEGGIVAGFDGGILKDLAPSNGYDILKSFDIAVNRKKFIPESWRETKEGFAVEGKAGNLSVTVTYKLGNGKMDVFLEGSGKITEVRFLIEPCDFEPLVIRGMNNHFVQGRHASYGFRLPLSRSVYMAGKLVILKRNPGRKVKLEIFVDEDLQRVKERMGLLEGAKELKVVDEDGNPVPGIVLVENADGSVYSAAKVNEEGIVRISLEEGAKFSILWGEDYEISSVKDGKIVLKVPKNGWRWMPYLAGAKGNTVWVAMRTWRPARAEVIVNGKTYTDGLIDTFHMIEVDDVEKPVKAVVKAGKLKGEVMLKPLKVKKFLVYGDTRTNEDWHEMVCNAMAEENADFVIHTGDLVESGDLMVDWDKFFKAAKNLYSKTPIFPTLGNHERNSPIYYQAFELRKGEGDFEKRWYSYTIGDVYFIVLDSNVAQGTSLYKEQTRWLEEELKKAQSYKFRIVYFHHPFFTNSPNREPSLKEEWKELFEKYKVQLVLNGHIHHYERFKINGVTYVTTGGGGAPLGFGLMSANRKNLAGTKEGKAGYLHYVVARVKENGIEFKVKAVARYNWGNLDRSVKGEVIDEFFIPFE